MPEMRTHKFHYCARCVSLFVLDDVTVRGPCQPLGAGANTPHYLLSNQCVDKLFSEKCKQRLMQRDLEGLHMFGENHSYFSSISKINYLQDFQFNFVLSKNILRSSNF